MGDILLIQGNVRDAQTTLNSFRENGLLNLVHVVSDGRQALDFLLSPKMLELRSGRQPALILLGLGIPLIEAPELLQILKGDPRTNMIPTIVVTSTLFDHEIRGAIKCRADGFVEKPLTFRKLLLMAKTVGVSLSYRQQRRPDEDRSVS